MYSPDLGRQQDNIAKAREQKVAEKRNDQAEMHNMVQQYKEDEYQRKMHEKDIKNQRMNDMQRQLEENKRLKDEKLREEKAKDAALNKEYDRMMQEREFARKNV
jgi:hypothetical protein